MKETTMNMVQNQINEACTKSDMPSDALNRIICGSAEVALKSVESQSVDLVITDPPYLCGYKDRSGRTVANDTDASGVLPVFSEIYRVLKQDSYCISFYGWSAIAGFASTWDEAGFRVVGQIVWPKEYASSKGYLSCQHEAAFLLAKGNPKKPETKLDDVQPWQYTGNKSHPTEKSVDIITPLIRAFSQKGDVVLDPFLGSGTTAVAAALTGRQYLGVELEQHYCTIAERRLNGVMRYLS